MSVGFVMVLAIVSAACDKAQLLAPSNSNVTLTTASAVVPLGGTTEVTAFVSESSGTPVQNGTIVRFTTNLGQVEPVEAQTRNGYAAATFAAGNTSGVAQVRATSGAIGGTTSTVAGSLASNVVQITIGGAATETVVATASPSSVPTGGGTVTIMATVFDVSGNRLQNISVSFSSDAGNLSATSATTDANGEARVQLTTNRQTVVTARAGAKTGTVTVTVDAPLQISATPSTGTTLTTFSFTVTPAQGSSPTDVNVDFGDGQNVSLGPIRTATTTPHQYSTTGTRTVRATQTNPDGSTSTATVVVVVN